MNKCVVSRYNAVHSYKKKLSRLLKAHLKNRIKKNWASSGVHAIRKSFLRATALLSSCLADIGREGVYALLPYEMIPPDIPKIEEEDVVKTPKENEMTPSTFFFFFNGSHFSF